MSNILVLTVNSVVGTAYERRGKKKTPKSRKENKNSAQNNLKSPSAEVL